MILAHTCRDVKSFAREVRADLLPASSAIDGLPQGVGSKVENVRINWRKDNRLRAQHTEFLRAKWLGQDVLRLAGAPVIARQLATVDDVRIERIGDNVPVFLG